MMRVIERDVTSFLFFFYYVAFVNTHVGTSRKLNDCKTEALDVYMCYGNKV